MIMRSVGWGLLLVVVAGCGVNSIDLYACTWPDIGHRGPDGEPDPCHEQDVDGGADLDGGADANVDGGEDAGEDAGEDGGAG